MPGPPPDTEPTELAELRRALGAAAEGLVYSSESDRPFEFFALPAPANGDGGAPTPAEFARLVGAPPSDPVEERDLDRFFARHLELTDPADAEAQGLRPRYEALKALVRARLADTGVIRVGRVQVRCFVVGRTPGGALAGLVTTAVET